MRSCRGIFLALFYVLAFTAPASPVEMGLNLPVSISGTLVSQPRVYPDGNRITFPAIRLDQPITVKRGSNPVPTGNGISLIQLVLPARDIATYQELKSRRVTIAGRLFPSENGKHYTSVVMDVTSIKP